jgi:peptidoglycan/LPS O-acetylase OafA/YrhL
LSRIPEIQGLRAVAVTLVVVYHSGLPLKGGFIGVDIFFVISGYVITRLLAHELDASGRVRFGRFYTRRVRRLLPAMAMMVAVTAVGSMLIQSPIRAQGDTANAGIGAVLWFGNVALYFVTNGYFADNPNTVPFLHTWSLAVEEQFYLFFPLLLAIAYLLARKVRRRGAERAGRTWAMGLITGVLVVSLLSSVALTFGALPIPASEGVAFFSPVSRAWEFAAGALIALWAAGSSILSRRRAGLAGLLGVLLLAGSAVLIPATEAFPGYIAVVPVLGTSLLLLSVKSPSVLGRPLSTRLAGWLGDMSYGWYLWHWPLIVFADALWPGHTWVKIAAAVVGLGVAWASFTWLEQPIRTRRPVRPWATLRLIFACTVPPLLLLTFLAVQADRHWGDPAIQSLSKQVEPVSFASDTCQTLAHLQDRPMEKCTFPGASSEPPLLLLGDSNAGQYAEALLEVGRTTDRTVILATAPGCSFLDVRILVPRLELCSDFYEDALAWIRSQEPMQVVVASANEFVDDPQREFRDPVTRETSDDVQVKARMWQSSLERSFAELRASGSSVVQVSAIAHFYNASSQPWSPTNCTFFALRRDVTSCGESMPRQVADRMQLHGLAAESAAAREAAVPVIDIRSVLCPRELCTTNRGSFWLYREGVHITTRESTELAPHFLAALQ